MNSYQEPIQLIKNFADVEAEKLALLGGINEDPLLLYRRKGLNYYKKGRNAVWYRKGDIDDWLASGQVSKHRR